MIRGRFAIPTSRCERLRRRELLGAKPIDCAGMAKKKKIRANFRKNRSSRARTDDWTQRFASNDGAGEDAIREERISGKGELTRKRTVVGASPASEREGSAVCLDVDESA
jgi:hypothetical protein